MVEGGDLQSLAVDLLLVQVSSAHTVRGTG